MPYVSDLMVRPYSANTGFVRRDTAGSTGDLIGTNLVADGVINMAATGGVNLLSDGVRPGDVAQVSANGGADNNGFYYITEVPTETLIVVQTTFTPFSDGNDRLRVWQDIDAVIAPTTISSAFAADNRIQAVGAQFITNGVRPLDVVYVDQDGNNNGQFMVLLVETEDIIQVQTFMEGAVVFTAAAATGRVTISRSKIALTVTDEALPTFTAVSALLPMSCPSDVVDSELTVFRPIFGAIVFNRNALTDTDWIIENEAVIRVQGSSRIAEWTNQRGDQGNMVTITYGTPGPDRFGASNSSMVYGFNVIQRGADPGIQNNVYGSYIGSSQSMAPNGVSYDLNASLVKGSPLDIQGPTNVQQESTTFVASEGALIVSGDHDIGNHLQTNATSASIVFAGAGGSTLRGFLKSSQVISPMLSLLGADVVFADAREDYSLTELFDVSSGSGTTTFTYNPRFVDRAGAVIVGAKVRIRVFNGLTDLGDIVGSPFTTTAAGRINVDLGVELLKFTTSSPASTFSHLVEVHNGVSGANYSPFSKFIIMRSALDVDEVVDWEQVDFEGEYRGGV